MAKLVTDSLSTRMSVKRSTSTKTVTNPVVSWLDSVARSVVMNELSSNDVVLHHDQLVSSHLTIHTNQVLPVNGSSVVQPVPASGSNSSKWTLRKKDHPTPQPVVPHTTVLINHVNPAKTDSASGIISVSKSAVSDHQKCVNTSIDSRNSPSKMESPALQTIPTFSMITIINLIQCFTMLLKMVGSKERFSTLTW
jgi:hypothetical protein